MWWSRALVCLMVLALGPAGCGFQPIYAKPRTAASSAVAAQMAAIRVAAIPDRLGQQVRNELVGSLSPRGEPAAPRYQLVVELIPVSSGVASSKDGNATIENMSLTSTYRLVDLQRDQVLHAGTARIFTSYRYLGPRYASTAAERESESTAASEIATSIRAALIAYFSDPATFNQRQAEAARTGRVGQPTAQQPAPDQP